MTACRGGEAAAPSDALKLTADKVQELINALPALDELRAMTAEEQQAAYMEIQNAYKAYRTLTAEQQTQITGADALEDLLAYFTDMAEPLDLQLDVSGGSEGTDFKFVGSTLQIMTDTPMTIMAAAAGNRATIEVAAAVANLTFSTLSLNGPDNRPAVKVGSGKVLNLTINGSVVLMGGRFGAGIQVSEGAALNLNITSKGSLMANGGSGGAGIDAGSTGTVIITGGMGTVEGKDGSFDIVGGTIILLTGGITGSGGGKPSCDPDAKRIWPTEVNNQYRVESNLSLPQSLTIRSGDSLIIGSGKELTIPADVTLTNDGTIINDGTIDNKGAIVNNGTIKGSGTLTPKLDASIAFDSKLNLNKTEDGKAVSLPADAYTYTGNGRVNVEWYKDDAGQLGEKLNSAPSTPGDYWVKVSAEETGIYNAVSEQLQFTISAKQTSGQTPPPSTGGGSGGGTARPVYSTLTFDTGGGSGIDSISKPYGETVQLSGYTPARKDYTFTGWYSDKGLTRRITEIKLTGSKTVYAGWVRAGRLAAPQTGDSSGIALFSGLMLMSAAAAAIISPQLRRRRERGTGSFPQERKK